MNTKKTEDQNLLFWNYNSLLMSKFKKMKKLLNRPLPPCIKEKVMKVIKEINNRENNDDKIQIKEE